MGGKTSKWDRKEFIALDGEGENSGEVEQLSIGDKKYISRDHIYTLLSASTGESLYNGGERLDSMACVDWLLDLAGEYPHAIFVIFAGGYDVNHILRGLDRGLIEEIVTGEVLEFEHDNERYQIQYRPRKSLSLKRGLIWKTKKDGTQSPAWADKIIIWDVFGFFQENFVGVMGKWLGKTHRHFELIKTMKARRGDFENVAQDAINKYNQAELETLVELMEKMHEGVDGLELKLMRFDGAGAVAAAMFRKHGIKEFKAEPPPEVLTAARCAYAGGRIEICKIGVAREKVFDYDVNSAYPAILRGLPSLQHGEWIHAGPGEPAPGFTLVHCRYKFKAGLPFYPLFYRSEKMQIIFGQSGEGWYWYPEYEQALKFPGEIEVLESWTFETFAEEKPFAWVSDYYETRKQWVANPTEEWQRGGEKIIKLGLNSLYGKTAQQVGGRDGEAPSYHQLEWAGYITSATRAKLLDAAIHDPDAIIGFATDGIFSTRELPLKISTDKSLGEWSLSTFHGLTVVMAGVYWWHNADGTYGHFSRGFDKDAMKDPSAIWEAWRKKQNAIDIPMYRLLGLSSACISNHFWEWRGRFIESMRTLALDGHSHKRNACDLTRKPHLGLVDLAVAPNIEYEMGLQACSYPYPLKWLEENENEGLGEGLEIERELKDTENI